MTHHPKEYAPRGAEECGVDAVNDCGPRGAGERGAVKDYGTHDAGERGVDAVKDYGAVAKTLHWLIAALVLALLTLGLIMPRVSDWQLKFSLYQLHKSLGVTVLLLMGVRLAWRAWAKPPALPPMPAWERWAAGATHAVLYVLLFILPLTGWAVVSASAFKIPTLLYGLAPWPHIPALAELSPDAKKTVEPLLKNMHATLGWALLVLVALHIAAALRHGLMLKDGVMSRMLPRFLVPARWRKLLVFAGMFAGLMVAGAPTAHAQEWALDKAKSRITFEASAGGQAVAGQFQHFQAEIRFDPDEPKEAEISASIDINSLSTGQAEADAALIGPEWFDTQNFPNATLRAVSVKQIDEGHYEMAADLTIKGITKRLKLPFQLDVTEGEGVARTEAAINRRDFKLGPDGAVAGMVIADSVRVVVVVAATRLDN